MRQQRRRSAVTIITRAYRYYKAHREVARIKAEMLKNEQNPARELHEEIADAVLGNIEVWIFLLRVADQ